MFMASLALSPATTAEEIFGWKNVHKHNGELVGKKKDKLGRSERYLKELSKITKANALPSGWGHARAAK